MADYDVNANLSINTALAGWNGDDDTVEMAAGLTYRLPRGLTLRAADKRMKTSRSALERLLDPDNDSVTLLTMERAAKALGKSIRIELAA